MCTDNNKFKIIHYLFLSIILSLICSWTVRSQVEKLSLEFDEDLELECLSASNDWYIHVDATPTNLKLYSSSIWNQSRQYYQGLYNLEDSDFKIKDIQFNQRCHEVSDKNNIMKLSFCVVTDEKYYLQKDIKEDEKIQSMYEKGYFFGMGEIEFFISPSPIASGTLFYCFEKKDIEKRLESLL